MWIQKLGSLVAAALLAPLVAVLPAAAGPSDLPAPTNTSAVSVTHSQQRQPTVTAIRLGRHPAYDRVVFDIHGAVPSYFVRYTHGLTYENGRPVPIRGAAVLAVTLNSVDVIHTPAAPGLTALPAIRDVEGYEAYEGYLGYGIGVTDRNGFRVFELQHPTRLVIDVAHDLPAPTSTARQYSPLGDDQNATLVGIRTGSHPAYDRVVFDFRGPTSGLHYVVGYMNLGSMGWWLRVDLVHGVMRDMPGSYPGPWIFNPAQAQLKTIRIFDAYSWGTTVLLKLGRTAGFRVFRLTSPDRIVVDVAH
jgi:hypothetical protein